MLTRRSMIRALGFGVPAAAVAAALPGSGAVSAPAPADMSALNVEWSPAVHPTFAETVAVPDLDALCAGNFRQIVAEDIAARGPLARQIERSYGLRRSLV